ncbi:MAG: acyl-CoA dehydrogenase family protein, partial [Candidatus Puniceispirillaceae bacterium]
MQFGLTEEQELIVSTVRSFVETEIYPFEDEIEARGDVPAEIGQQIKDKVLEMGFYAANFPESVGGGGLNNLEFALLERELGRGSMA